ncbi:hypothetical protein BpHYR1_026540 [Brachionus plicatilis]|uniref:Uncharacterized protein n=1 Tax=Brachionus plicatilis TaxID=10195 RepID=A0A3M7P729_BRAPC|nr:hypothetical protein BpHYR1_026540 [Brachionus plicatilis]
MNPIFFRNHFILLLFLKYFNVILPKFKPQPTDSILDKMSSMYIEKSNVLSNSHGCFKKGRMFILIGHHH